MPCYLVAYIEPCVGPCKPVGSANALVDPAAYPMAGVRILMERSLETVRCRCLFLPGYRVTHGSCTAIAWARAFWGMSLSGPCSSQFWRPDSIHLTLLPPGDTGFAMVLRGRGVQNENTIHIENQRLLPRHPVSNLLRQTFKLPTLKKKMFEV